MVTYELLHKYGWEPVPAASEEEARTIVREILATRHLWDPKLIKIEKTVLKLEGTNAG